KSNSTNVNTVAFNQEGTLLVTGDVSGVLAVWDASNGNLLARYSRGATPLGAAEFTRDGSRVVASDEERVTMWDTASERRTREELQRYVRCRVPFQLNSGKLVDTRVAATCDQ